MLLLCLGCSIKDMPGGSLAVQAWAISTLILLGGLRHGFSGDHGRWPEIYGYVRAFFDLYLKGEIEDY